MENLLQNISTKVSLNAQLSSKIEENFEEVTIQKGEKLVSDGAIARYLYFINEGILNSYYYQDGRKVTSWFYDENQFVTVWYSFYTQKPGYEAIEALEDCHLYRISYSNYQKLIAEYPAFNNFARLLVEEAFIFLEEFTKGWSFLSAKEKYQLLLEYFPEVELRVKLGSIASLLGISQETLSRIRSEK